MDAEVLKTISSFGLSTVIVAIFISVIIMFIKQAPKYLDKFMEAFANMTKALENQNEVTERNTAVLDRSTSLNEDMVPQLLRIEAAVNKIQSDLVYNREAVDEITRAIEDIKNKVGSTHVV